MYRIRNFRITVHGFFELLLDLLILDIEISSSLAYANTSTEGYMFLPYFENYHNLI